VRHAGRLKSHIYATLQRNLVTQVPASDLFGKRGRAWLCSLELPVDERQTVESDLRRLDFSIQERGLLDKQIAQIALASPEIRRLMTIPGVDVVSAATMLAVIGDIAAFPRRATWSAMSGSTRACASRARPRRAPGGSPRRARARRAACSSRRPGRRSGRPVPCGHSASGSRRAAGVRWRPSPWLASCARFCWHLLAREQDYAYVRPALLRRKLRQLELRAGAPSRRGKRGGGAIRETRSRDDREKALALQAELSYRRLIADWQASRPKRGAGAAPGRASHGPSGGQAARQRSAPDPAL
jgi:transposase